MKKIGLIVSLAFGLALSSAVSAQNVYNTGAEEGACTRHLMLCRNPQSLGDDTCVWQCKPESGTPLDTVVDSCGGRLRVCIGFASCDALCVGQGPEGNN